MHIKPKDLRVNLPIVLGFDDYHEIPAFASAINAIIHGKLRLKYEELGLLENQYMGIFYLHRNQEFQELRDEFVGMIDKETMDAEAACGTDGQEYQKDNL
jgi:hypothetical protein